MQGKAGAPLLSFFWDLASVEADKRVTAAVSLISVLQRAQSEAATAGVACTDLAYAIRRLVRGLASPRDGARQGFGAALVELLVTFPKEVALESVLTLMEESMQLQGSMKGPEERDMLFGRVFTCAAVIRSARLATLATKPRAALVERLVLVAPHPDFVASLPLGKIPDRGDFTKLETEERLANWRCCLARGEELAEAFAAQVAGPDPLAGVSVS